MDRGLRHRNTGRLAGHHRTGGSPFAESCRRPSLLSQTAAIAPEILAALEAESAEPESPAPVDYSKVDALPAAGVLMSFRINQPHNPASDEPLGFVAREARRSRLRP